MRLEYFQHGKGILWAHPDHNAVVLPPAGTVIRSPSNKLFVVMELMIDYNTDLSTITGPSAVAVVEPYKKVE